MTIDDCLDEDFLRSLYERAMSDPHAIPQSLSAIAAAIEVVRAKREEAISEFDGTLAHLERIAADLRGVGRQTPTRIGTRRQPVVHETRQGKGLFPGSKRHRVYMIVGELTKEQASVRIPEIVAEMERRGLFANVNGNKTQNATNELHQLKQRRHLESDGRGNWFLPVRRSAE
jgi:hypothetical protein